MRALQQIVAVSAWNFRCVRSRFKPSLVAVVGFFGVVLVFVAILSIRNGLTAAAKNTGSADVAIVSASNGSLDGNALRAIAQAPDIAQGTNGSLIMGVFLTTAQLPTRASGLLGSLTFRGVSANMPQVWRKFRILQGRMFTPGVDEIIVGEQAERLFPGLAIGDTFDWNRHHWKVVGIFSDGGGIHDSEILTDVNQLQAAFNATNSYANAYVRLTSAAVFPAFKQAVEHNPQLGVTAVQENVSFAQSFQGLETLLTSVGGLITLLMAVGAVFGVINIMYANVASRMQDIATLRALGFSRFPVLCAVMLEGVVLGLVGGVIAAIVAYVVFNGYQASTSGNNALMGFSFAVTPGLMVSALVLAIVMGFIGGLFPAIRAAQLPVARALREV